VHPCTTPPREQQSSAQSLQARREAPLRQGNLAQRGEAQVCQVPWPQADSSNNPGRLRALGAQPAGTGRLRRIAVSLVVHLEQPNFTPRFLPCIRKCRRRDRAEF